MEKVKVSQPLRWGIGLVADHVTSSATERRSGFHSRSFNTVLESFKQGRISLNII